MDQAELDHQEVLGSLRECSNDAPMGSHLHIPDNRQNQGYTGQSLLDNRGGNSAFRLCPREDRPTGITPTKDPSHSISKCQ